MSLKQRLDQRQVQKLILAPALQQAIKLLPLTNLELIEVIDEELSQNPMIEIEDEAREAKPKDSETVAAEEAGVREPGRRPRRAEPRIDGIQDQRATAAAPTSWPASRNTWTRASGPTSARTAKPSPSRTPCPGRPPSGTT